MNDLIVIDAATSSVPSRPVRGFWTGKVAVGPRCVPPFSTLEGTGLPFGPSEGNPAVPTSGRTRPLFAGTGAHVGALGVDGVMGMAQAKWTVVRIPAATVQGDPPLRTPPRC